jgi:hypothetical protein
MEGWDSVADKSMEYSLRHRVQTGFGALSASYRGLFLRGKAIGKQRVTIREANTTFLFTFHGMVDN